MINHFDAFAKENLNDIKKAERLIIAPNGSWFPQVPKELREHIYDFIETNNIPVLKYECRSTLFKPEKARKELEIMYKAKHEDKFEALTDKALEDIVEGLKEIKPNHIVSFGLEVADDNDLEILNKGCCLEDYWRLSVLLILQQ